MSNTKTIILGRSGSGKNTLAEQMIAKNSNLRLARLHTSRKKRKSEDDNDYHFVSASFFEDNKEDFIFIERFQDTEDKLYGLTYKEFEISDIVIFAPEYFQYFPNNLLSTMEVIFLDISKPECIRRQLNRGDNPETVIRRAENDDISFSTILEHIRTLPIRKIVHVTE